MRQRPTGQYPAKRRLQALRVAILAAERRLAALNCRADRQRIVKMFLALGDAVAENVRLQEENCRVKAESDSMQSALHDAIRMSETDELTQLSTRPVLWDRLSHDIATSARPEDVQALFRRTVAVGAQFGVIVVLEGGREYEVATFRSDGEYRDGRHPESVTFTNAEGDAQRRHERRAERPVRRPRRIRDDAR